VPPRRACRLGADVRLLQAIGEGDRFSDIEFYLFFADEVPDGLQEQEAWVGQIAPLELYYVNEFGNGTAIFEPGKGRVPLRGGLRGRPGGRVGERLVPLAGVGGARRQERRTVRSGR
jgi:hypothetical protein